MIAQLDSLYIKIRPWKLWSRLLSYALFEGRPLTTKGRWINTLVFAHFAIEKHLPSLKKVRSPIFILGTGRSGTTILGIVLSMHKQVGFLNEPKALWHAVHQNEDLIGSYTLKPAKYRLAADEAIPNRYQTAHRLLAAYLALTFSQRVVDKYPELIFRVPFVRTLFPDAKFLFLVRNGWDTCHSIKGWSNRLGVQQGGDTHDWWGVNRRKWNLLVDQIVPEHTDLAPHAHVMRTWTNQTDMAAVEWIITMREGLRIQAAYPNDVIRVNYEELCISPREILNRITNFCQLSLADEPFLQYAEQTLQPVRTRLAFALNPEIETAFQQTMIQLGYKI